MVMPWNLPPRLPTIPREIQVSGDLLQAHPLAPHPFDLRDHAEFFVHGDQHPGLIGIAQRCAGATCHRPQPAFLKVWAQAARRRHHRRLGSGPADGTERCRQEPLSRLGLLTPSIRRAGSKRWSSSTVTVNDGGQAAVVGNVERGGI